MTDLATFIVPALLTLGIGSFLLVLFAGAVEHWRWSRGRRGRGGMYR